jgi:hypothetical protein
MALSTTVVLAQTPAAGGHHDGAAEQAAPHAGVGMGTQNMPDQKAMMQRMAAADQKLDQLVAKMNAATGDEKVAAIAAVVTELAAQRRQMRAMMQMQGGMMEQMMMRMSTMHQSGGMMKKAPEPASGANDKDHAAHHPEK